MSTLKQRLLSRKFILTLLGNVTGLAIILWPEHESEIVQASTNIGGLLLMALTTLGYVTAEGKVDTARTENQRYDQLPSVVLLGCLLVGMSGCQLFEKVESPEVAYKVLSDTYSDTLLELVNAHTLGVLSSEDLQAIYPYRVEVGNAIDSLHKAIELGEATNIEYWLSAARQRLDELIRQIELKKEEVNNGTERDSGSNERGTENPEPPTRTATALSEWPGTYARAA